VIPDTRASGFFYTPKKNSHQMASKKGNVKIKRELGPSKRWLAALDDFRNWLIREAA
jgi:hypothetical protein